MNNETTKRKLKNIQFIKLMNGKFTISITSPVKKRFLIRKENKT